MEKYLVPVPPPSQTRKSAEKRFRWSRNLIELNGKMDSKYRHQIAGLSMQSYALVGNFPHHYHTDSGDLCPTHVNWVVGGDIPQQISTQGVTALEFDSKGTYLASVTTSGCFTVHDYDELLCRGKEDETKQVLHIATGEPFDVVRWNLANQYEVACTSRRSGEVRIYDIGYVSSEPVQMLKMKSAVGINGTVVHKGFFDVAFSSNDDSRVLASDMIGVINVWDRRASHFPYLHLRGNSWSTINSIKFNVDNQVVFGGSQNGMIHMWDLRGGSSFTTAFENIKMAYSPLASVKLSSELEKIGSLKAQTNIAPKEILSIDLNPSCPHQLAFHLDDGWSGVFDLHNLRLTHIHCPPPPWLIRDDYDDLEYYMSYMRKPSWLPVHSIYAVGSSSNSGLHLLDFYQDRTSPCHVEYNEELQGMNAISGKQKRNIFIPLPEAITACAAHPIHGAIVVGTKRSSLLLLSQESIPSQETDDSRI